MAVVEVAFSDLNTWLQAQPANTVDTPYELEITGLTEKNIGFSYTQGSLGNVIRNNSTKYVDLSATNIPNVIGMSDTFEGCTSLVTAPEIPSSVTGMTDTFYRCTSLVTAPEIPNSVTSLIGTFGYCTSLVTAPEIPSSVIGMVGAFEGCTSLVTAPEIPNSVSGTGMYHTFEGCTSLVTAPEMPSRIEGMSCTFKGCTSLVTAPEIPSRVTSLIETFEGCTSLVTVPEIPSSVTDMSQTFRGCNALTSWRQKNVISTSLYFRCFGGCTNLVNIYSNKPYELKEWLNTIRTDETDNFPKDPNTLNYYPYSSPEEPLEISIDNLNNELATLNANTVNSPFNIKITDLVAGVGDNCYDIRTTLLANPTKYVDLHTTELPIELTNMTSFFENCSSLVVSPEIPDGVTDLDNAFTGTSIIESPAIPDSVTSMDSTFKGCTSLETVPNVPANVTILTDCFKNCSSLEEIEVFEVPLSVLKSNLAGDCFSGCTSLTKIGIRGAGRSSDWHIALLEFGATTVKGKFYDRQGNSVTIPETTITKNKLKLPVLTDELMFNTQTSFADLESLIEDVLQYNYGYYNKFVVTPKNKQFVLYANDPVNGFTTNLPIGGGGASDHTPLGTWASFESGVAPSDKWLEAGTRFNAVDYPELYMYLNDTTVPERFDHNKLSDYETVVIPKGSSNPFIAPYDGLLYVNGYTDANDSYKLFINGRETTVSSSIMNTSSYRGIDSETIHISKGDSIYYTGSGQTQAYSSFVQYYKQHLFIKATTGADVETAVSLSTSWYDALKTSMYTYETANIVSSVSNSGEGGGTSTLVFCKVNKALKKIRLRIDLQNASRNSFVINTIFDSTKFKVETATMPIQITFTNKTVNSGLGGSYSYVLTSVYENYNRISIYSYPHEFDPTGALSLLLDIDYSMCSTGYGLLES